MSKRLSVVVAASLLLALGPAVSAEADVPTYRTRTVFAQCIDGSKLQNDKVVTWTLQPPLIAFVSVANAGCFHQQTDGVTDPVTWQGPITGNIRSLTVNADNFVGASAYRVEGLDMTVSVTIDGEPIVENAEISLPPNADIWRNGALTELASFSVVDIPSHFASEIGNGTTVHEVVVSFAAHGSANNWAWGCAEAPSGVVFNPASPAATTISAA